MWAGFVLLLVAVTYPLWFPIGDALEFPSVSLVSATSRLRLLPAVILIAALIAVLVAPERLRWSWWLVAACLVFSFLIDQHRLQPWAYQTAIYACVFASLRPTTAKAWLVPLAASIYIYSAMGKFDYQFTHTIGQDFLNTVLGPLGGLPADWDSTLRVRLALAFPMLELAGGLGLLLPATRRYGAVIVMVMHATLLWILGPWGLGHSHGVLIWNLALIAQGFFLFIAPVPEPETGASPSALAPLTLGVVLVALFAPLLERWGYWDHWPAWALYAPHNSRVDVEVHQSVIARLPESLQLLTDDDPDADRWHQLNTGRWSLRVRRVAIYPQARYQLALADLLAARYALQDGIRLRQRSQSDRWTGRRREQLWLGDQEIKRALQQYWLVNQ